MDDIYIVKERKGGKKRKVKKERRREKKCKFLSELILRIKSNNFFNLSKFKGCYVDEIFFFVCFSFCVCFRRGGERQANLKVKRNPFHSLCGRLEPKSNDVK